MLSLKDVNASLNPTGDLHHRTTPQLAFTLAAVVAPALAQTALARALTRVRCSLAAQGLPSIAPPVAPHSFADCRTPRPVRSL